MKCTFASAVVLAACMAGTTLGQSRGEDPARIEGPSLSVEAHLRRVSNWGSDCVDAAATAEGRTAFHNGKHEAAEELLTRAIAENPASATAYFYRASAREALGELESAYGDFSRAIALAPDLAEAYHARARVSAAQGNSLLAVKDYERVLELGPMFRHRAHEGLARVLLAAGEPVAALEQADLALFNMSQSPDPYLLRAEALESLGRTEEATTARTMAEAVASLYPDGGC